MLTVPFDPSNKNLARLARAISPDRLKSYLVRARGDLWIALQLYRRNADLSEALYGVVQGCEVFLRNATHEKLAKTLTEKWWNHTSLRERERADIDDAIASIQTRAAEVTTGRVVAELNLGFWTNLYSNFYERDLWVPHLRHLFPMSMQRKRLHERMENIKLLRNRIAHHESLLRRDVRQDYADLLETVGWISPTLRSWIEDTNCFEERVAKKLAKRPKLEVKPDDA
jgi:hypothetical protein